MHAIADQRERQLVAAGAAVPGFFGLETVANVVAEIPEAVSERRNGPFRSAYGFAVLTYG